MRAQCARAHQPPGAPAGHGMGLREARDRHDLLWQARMSTQAPEIDGFCYVNDYAGAPPRRGEIRRMRITEAHDYDLIGGLDVASERALPIAAANAFPILAMR